MTRPGAAGPGQAAASTPTHGVAGVADAGAFLARLVRLDPIAPVRLRPAGGPGLITLWARLPWQVLVGRTVAGGPADGIAEDVTVAAAELLAELERGGATLPPRRDAQWRWPLPPVRSRQVEALPVAELRRIADAAAGTLRTASEHGVAGRAVGQRVLRDALLDHVAVLVTPDGSAAPPVEVSQRLVQGVVRMGFLGAADGPAAGNEEAAVQVRVAGRWVGLVGPYGAAWLQKATDLAVTPLSTSPNG
ncbi:hypothetical protein [Micromonospora luteifusca]|uniref:hypothetical protein n=1 Tax=Micromonospora luteifusca TaxID=709860 RepID=UPI0033AAF75F